MKYMYWSTTIFCALCIVGCQTEEDAAQTYTGPTWRPQWTTTNPSRAIEVTSLPHLVVFRDDGVRIVNVNGTYEERPYRPNRSGCRLTLWGTEENLKNCIQAIIDAVTEASEDDFLTSARSGGGDADLLMRAARSSEVNTDDGPLHWMRLIVQLAKGKKEIIIIPSALMKNKTGDALVTQRSLETLEAYRTLTYSDSDIEIRIDDFDESDGYKIPLQLTKEEWVQCPAGDFRGQMRLGVSEGFDALYIGPVHSMWMGDRDDWTPSLKMYPNEWIRHAVTDIVIR